MEVKKEIQDQILQAIAGIGTNGATITEIEKNVHFERHTLSKYLSFLQGHGFIYHKLYGKAKVWFINKAPLQTIINSQPESRTFTENFLLNLCSNIPVGVMVIDKDYNIQFMNDILIDKYGHLEGKKFYENVLDLKNPLKLEKISKVINRYDTKTAEVQLKDKFENILDIKVSKIINPDETVSAILIIEDITTQKRIEEGMKKLSRVVEQTADIVMITDTEGIIEYVNPAWEKVTGYKKEEAIGKKPNILKSEKHSKKFYESLWNTVLSGKPYHNILIDRKKNGKLFYEQKTITPIYDNKKITHFVSTGKISDIHQLPKKMLK